MNTSREPGTTLWTHLTNGFQLSGTLQYYSALPLNITSGVTTVQGTAGRPIVDGAVHPPERRHRDRTSSPSTSA